MKSQFIQNQIKLMAQANQGYNIDIVGGSLFVNFMGSNKLYKANTLQTKLYNWFNKILGKTKVKMYSIGKEGFVYDFI